MLQEQIDRLSQSDVQDYIFLNEQQDEHQLLLKNNEILGLPPSIIADQLAGRRKVRQKLPTWYSTRGIIYPPKLNLEQSSSEITANHKSTLFPKGKIAVDLTGGFGVDSFFLSRQFEHFFYVEPDLPLLNIARHNHHLLGAQNIEYINTTAEEFINQNKIKFDLIFVDPSRRSKHQRVFKLADCIPNVTELVPALLQQSDNILIKNSPLLDIHQGISELNRVDRVLVVAVQNECKELLFHINRRPIRTSSIEAIEFDGAGHLKHTFMFQLNEEKERKISLSPPLIWLYEPSAAILKAGAFKTTAERYFIHKLQLNTHLYTSEKLIDHFPGRVFAIREEVKMDKKLKGLFPEGYANIITRNYPLSVDEIKKKTGLREGGDLFLICTQSEKSKHVIIAERFK